MQANKTEDDEQKLNLLLQQQQEVKDEIEAAEKEIAEEVTLNSCLDGFLMYEEE